MQNKISKIDSTTKFKIIFLMILSNLSLWLLLSATEPSDNFEEIPKIELVQRKDFIFYKVEADILTPFKSLSAVTITNKQRSFIIPFAQMISQEVNVNRVEETINYLEQKRNKGKYTIYVHKKFINQLLNQPDLKILPFIENFKVSKRRSTYEVKY